MANVLELILNAVDNTSKTLQDIQANGANLEKQLTANWKAIGLAAAAAGAGLEVLARKQGELAEQTSKVSIATGLTEQELNELARSVAGAGDSIGETLTVMQTGAEQGLKSAEALEEYASYWDLVGDASGENSEALAAAAVSLESFGISAENISDSADAFGYVLNNTTLSLGEFEEICSRVGPSVSDLGLSIDDMAIIMDSLEERGITGKKAISAITDAAKAADGDINKFASALGISTTALNTAEQATDGYAMKLDDMAAAHDENITAIEKMSSYLGELQYKYGDLIVQASALAPALIAVGPAIKIFDTLKTAVTDAGGAIPLLTTNLAGIGSAIIPLLPIIAGLALAAAALYVAWQTNFLGIRDITAQAGDFIKDRVSAIKDTLSDLGERIAPTVDKLKGSFGKLMDSVDGLFKKFAGGKGVVDVLKSAFELLGRIVDTVAKKFISGLGDAIDWVIRGLTRLVDGVTAVVDWFSRLADNPVVQFFTGLTSAAAETTSGLLDRLVPAVDKTNTGLTDGAAAAEDMAGGLDKTTASADNTGQSTSTLTGLMGALGTTGTGALDGIAGAAGRAEIAIERMQAFVRDATGAWQGLQEIINTGSTYYNYNEKTGIWEHMVPAADGQGFVPIGSKGATGGQSSPGSQQPGGSSGGGGGGTPKPTQKFTEAEWAAMSDAQKEAVRSSGAYQVGDNKYNSTPTPASDYEKDPDYEGFINDWSGIKEQTPSPHGHDTSQEKPLYITKNVGQDGKEYYQAYYEDRSEDSGVWGVNISQKDISKWIGEGVGLHEYDPSNYLGGNKGAKIATEATKATDAMEDMTSQTETLTSTTYDLVDAADSAASASDGYSSSLYDTSGASDIAASASDGLTGSLYGTATAAGKSLAAMNTMGAGMVARMDSTSNSVLGTFAAMGAGAAQSTGYISDICANLFGSIQNQAIAAMSAISRSSCADGSCRTLSTSTGGAGSPILTDGTSCTGLNCGGILPGSGIYDMGESWTTRSGSFTTTTAYDYTSSSLFDGILNPFLASLYPAMAEGGNVTGEGWSIIGEKGPELKYMPKGASVVPLDQSKSIVDYDRIGEAVAAAVTRAIGSGVVRDLHLHGNFFGDEAAFRQLNRKLKSVNNMESVRTGV